MTRKILVACLYVLIASGLFACGSDHSDPVANAGVDQNVTTGTLVTLDGSSSDGAGELLVYTWAFVSIPPGSNAKISDATVVRPTFTADVDGVYVVQLVVNTSDADTVSVTAATANSAPVANAGRDQSITTGSLVTLDGSASSDANNDPLDYSWSFVSLPPLSNADISATTVVGPTFTADIDGDYVLQLIVRDGVLDSVADTVRVTAATANSTPVAYAGPDQSITTGSLVTLDGSASSDADSDPLTYQWSLTSVPAGSGATLSDLSVARPTFTTDVDGNYVFSLIVSDGLDNSTADSVTITATTTPAVPTVTSSTGRVWMDRNLGATQVATAVDDPAAYGDLYQWGRGTDGHEKRDSLTTATLSISDTPVDGNFITTGSSPLDWRDLQNVNLWQGVSGTNNPCPAGFRLPTEAEWSAEASTWSTNDSAGAFASPLKLVSAGFRGYYDGAINFAGSDSYYWSSSVDGIYSRYLYFFSGNATTYNDYRAYGHSVRCLED